MMISTLKTNDKLGLFCLKVKADVYCTEIFPYADEKARDHNLPSIVTRDIQKNDHIEREYIYCREILNADGSRTYKWTEGDIIAVLNESGQYVSASHPHIINIEYSKSDRKAAILERRKIA